MNPLPIDEALPRVIAAFEVARNVILSAPPGAGKTTRVPLELIAMPWLEGRKIIMLEPRRLAARRAADYMARQLKEETGKTVGYRIRGDAKVSSATRIEVVTEGILTRMIHGEPELPGVGLVIFDEFHERSIHADLGLALTLDVQEHLRDDLRLLVMSATLDGVALNRVLGKVPVVESEGQSYPVETTYLESVPTDAVEETVAHTVHRALREAEGDILVFLPGQREIRRVERLLEDSSLPEGTLLCTLHGDASPDIQHAALTPALPGTRKVILSTSIAESSLTIDGVRVVVDAGLARSARFDPRRGMSGLVTTTASRAAVNQRRGRAARQGPGVCYRLWTESRNDALPKHPTPEIVVADLAPLALDIARWGAGSAEGLLFIDPPPQAHLAQARSLLLSLGALDQRGALTPHGMVMANLPVHPRLAHMIVRAKELGLGSTACDVAALLEERDIVPAGLRVDVDLATRIRALYGGGEVDRGVRARVQAGARRLRELVGVGEEQADERRLGILLALAYPDRIARRRTPGGSRYQMANGTGAALPEWSHLSREEYLAIADVDGAVTDAKIFLAAPVDRAEIVEVFDGRVTEEDQVFWSDAHEAVIARHVQRLGSLILSETTIRPKGDAVRVAMADGIRAMGLSVLPWTKEANALRARSEWVRQRGLVPQEDWPDLTDECLTALVTVWLRPFLNGITRRAQLQKLDMTKVLRSLFTQRQLMALDALAPETIRTPSGSRIRLDYSAGALPVLAVRLQEMFGLTDTPAIAGGKFKVLIHLLSPANRPLAVTQDLKSFWTTTYPEVRKEMRGSYPKHVWPEDPLNALPTRKTKK
ncbi:MAG: ATP-dependent helicase HrpB [Bacteroidota bacterium]